MRPRKRFGQNFLVDPRFAQRIAQSIPAGAFVIEIGGGTGSLTAVLLERTRSLEVLEIDRDLVALLHERFSDAPHLTIREADALEFPLAATLGNAGPPRVVCGNLPYSITTPLIERIIAAADHWESAVLMVQREYAQRLAARPGTSEYGSLTLFVAYYCTVEKLFDVGAAGFYPAPAVASSVMRLEPRHDRRSGVHDERLLLKLIRAAFAQRRKTLVNCIAARVVGDVLREQIAAALRDAGVDPAIRGERLDLSQFKKLTNALSARHIDLKNFAAGAGF